MLSSVVLQSIWKDLSTKAIIHCPSCSPKQCEPSDRLVNVQLRNKLSMLKKACNHPYLVEYPLLGEEFRIDEDLVKASGKMLLLDRMLKELKAKGHKVGLE